MKDLLSDVVPKPRRLALIDLDDLQLVFNNLSLKLLKQDQEGELSSEFVGMIVDDIHDPDFKRIPPFVVKILNMDSSGMITQEWPQ
jgi:hypothetical protein